ncbi:MAG TPA: aldo/keto reductase [Polyangiaceae bacterium]
MSKETTMQYVSAKGVKVPALGLGTWKLRGRECQEVVEHALELGYRHFDTAQMYGNEADVGVGIRQSGIERSELWVTTKLWLDNLAYDAATRTTHESLKRLATPYVDLLLIHWPHTDIPLEVTLEAMVRLHDQGLVRCIGVSNFTPALLSQALRIAPISAVQLEYHPRLSQARMLAMARRSDLIFTAHSPLARGGVLSDPTLSSIGERYGKTVSQVTLRWLIQQENVVAIPKASSYVHLAENANIFDFELTRQDMDRIGNLTATAQRIVDPVIAPDWSRPMTMPEQATISEP